MEAFEINFVGMVSLGSEAYTISASENCFLCVCGGVCVSDNGCVVEYTMTYALTRSQFVKGGCFVCMTDDIDTLSILFSPFRRSMC